MADPKRILRRGIYMFFGGLSLALIAVPLEISLSFMFMYGAGGLLLLSFLAYWRETGIEIMSPGMTLVLISYSFVLAIVAGVMMVASFFF